MFLKNLLLFAVDDGCLENTPDTAEFSREFSYTSTFLIQNMTIQAWASG